MGCRAIGRAAVEVGGEVEGLVAVARAQEEMAGPARRTRQWVAGGEGATKWGTVGLRQEVGEWATTHQGAAAPLQGGGGYHSERRELKPVAALPAGDVGPPAGSETSEASAPEGSIAAGCCCCC